MSPHGTQHHFGFTSGMSTSPLRQSSFLRRLLQLAVVVLVLSAGTAIVAVARGGLGDVEARIITSAGVILVAASVAAVGLDARERRTAPTVGVLAATLATLAGILTLVVIWVPPSSSILPRAMAISAVLALSLALHAGLRTWAARPRWLVRAAVVLGYVTALQASVIIAREDATTPEARALAATLIMLGLALALVPILARLAGTGSEGRA